MRWTLGWVSFLAGALSAACTEQRPECVLGPEAGQVDLRVPPQGRLETLTGTVTVEPLDDGSFGFAFPIDLRSAVRGTFKVPGGAALVGSWYGELQAGAISTLREGQLVLRTKPGAPPHFAIWGLATRAVELREVVSVDYQSTDCVSHNECMEWSAATMVVTSSVGGQPLRLAPGARAELGGYVLGNGASFVGHRQSAECLDVFAGYASGYFLQLSPAR